MGILEICSRKLKSTKMFKQFKHKKDLELIKEIIKELSVNIWDDKNWLCKYPIANIDILRDLIIDSELCFGLFDSNNNLNWCILAYKFDDLLKLNQQDKIIEHLLKNEENYQKWIYLDMICIRENMQQKWIAKLFIKQLKSVINDNYNFILSPIILSPHRNEISIRLAIWNNFFLFDNFSYDWMEFWIYRLNL